MQFTKAELLVFLKEQEKVFDIVRLVDVSTTTQYTVTDSGELLPQPYMCYAVWNKERRCDNCISAKAFAQKTQMSKFEFVNDEVYFVMSAYVEVDGQPYTLEMVRKLDDETLFGAYGKTRFIETIESHNRKLFVDPLTGAYNRRYYDEQLSRLEQINAVVMVDVDHFKEINDRYGHAAGDFALTRIVETIHGCMRASDAVIRYGGDEFLLAFRGIPVRMLHSRLEEMRARVEAIRSEEYPQLRLTISMGALHAGEESALPYLRQADEALYRAKETRNRVVLTERTQKKKPNEPEL